MTYPWEQYLVEQEPQHLEKLKDFLHIPSVSALPQHRPDMQQAADWLVQQLQAIGIPEITILSTENHPVVYGCWPVSSKYPTIMIYGHYDVQPPNPLDRWESPPFDLVIREGRMYGRGVSDDKGNLLAALQAVEALVKTQKIPLVNLKFFWKEKKGSTVRVYPLFFTKSAHVWPVTLFSPLMQ